MSRRTPPNHRDPDAFAGLRMRLERRAAEEAAAAPSLALRLRAYFRAGVLCAAIVAVAILGAFVTTAEAAPFTPSMEANYAWAEDAWGREAYWCADVTKEARTREEMPLEEGYSELYGLASITEERFQFCFVLINSELTPCREKWTVLHEFGHLVGYHHEWMPRGLIDDPCPVEGEADLRLWPGLVAEVRRLQTRRIAATGARVRRQCAKVQARGWKRRADRCWKEARGYSRHLKRLAAEARALEVEAGWTSR